MEMTSRADSTPLPIVLGPTGSGKSELGIRIAVAVGGEIVNCDSVQIYRGFDIGTAKVPEVSRRGIPHHLVDVIDPTELFTAGDYARVGRRVLGEIADRRRIPVVVGGTGFYLRALLEGLFRGPARDPSIRRRLEARAEKRPSSLHRLLTRLDPRAASRIHSNDKNKIIRALEIRLLAGKPLSTLLEGGREPLTGFHAIKIGLNPPRKLLCQHLDDRAAHMFERGLIDEVRGLLASGVPRDAKPFESLGYKQALAVVEGRLTSDEALDRTRRETRQYAKRQMTWFRKEPGVHWLDGFGNDPNLESRAMEILKKESGL